tara:strand:- start:140 stop:547 length:408 start_codon:yes stop_codon:yes gene_type:complete
MNDLDLLAHERPLTPPIYKYTRPSSPLGKSLKLIHETYIISQDSLINQDNYIQDNKILGEDAKIIIKIFNLEIGNRIYIVVHPDKTKHLYKLDSSLNLVRVKNINAQAKKRKKIKKRKTYNKKEKNTKKKKTQKR